LGRLGKDQTKKVQGIVGWGIGGSTGDRTGTEIMGTSGEVQGGKANITIEKEGGQAPGTNIAPTGRKGFQMGMMSNKKNKQKN